MGEYSRVKPEHQVQVIDDAREFKIPLTHQCGVLGMARLIGYYGPMKIGKSKAVEVIFVSAAMGAVGQIVTQIARILGLKVIGIAGSDEKDRYSLNELKFDAVINYKKKNIREALRAATPKGTDIYYDNVGGEPFEIASNNINDHGRRVTVCGLVSYISTFAPP
ncbi:hypothetical protein BGZ46_001951 [Entomortierella lignicola]|nr:hypothetical protein BGZ46_001951 [Entomortierella lignicola]